MRTKRLAQRVLCAEARQSATRGHRDRHSGDPISPRPPQGSSSSDSLEGQSCDYASKSYDAVVFDVLKVTPEEFAVSNRTDVGAGPTAGCWAGGVTAQGFLLRLEATHIPNNRGLLNKMFFMKYLAGLFQSRNEPTWEAHTIYINSK